VNCKLSVDERNCANSSSFTVLIRSLWLFELRATLDGPPMAKMNKESFELAEAIGDLFVENRVIALRATLNVIAIETAHSRNDVIDRAFTQATFIRACTIWTMTNAAQPLNEADQVIGANVAPVDSFPS